MDMLLDHFGLRRDPFEREPAPASFHPTRAHASALERVGSAVRTRTPLTVLEGPDGAGKTMILRCLAAELPERFQLVVVEREARRLGGLFTAISRALGLDGVSREQECRQAVARYLEQRAGQGYRTALAVDDAHTLPDHWVDQLDLITREEMLPVVLASAGPVAGTSGLPAASRLREAVAETVRLERIEVSECSGYLQALLMSAGARESRLFRDDAIGSLHELSHGLPGRLASLSSRALVIAYGRGRDTIDEESVLEAAEQLAAGRPLRKLHAVVEPKPGRPARARVEPIKPVEPVRPVQRPMQNIENIDKFDRVEEAEEIEAVAVRGGETRRLAAVAQGPAPLGPTSGPSGSVAGSIGVTADGGAAGSAGGLPADTPAWSADDLATGGGAARASEDPAKAAGYPDAEAQKRLLAGMRRPDRPSWARSKTDPFRHAGPAQAPFGPEMLPVISDPHGSVAEWFRMVRLGLEEWMEAHGDSARSVIVTSAESEAGKTFVAVNLALLFANEPGCRVLLVDGDMRFPRFESLFGTSGRPGLADVLAGRSTLADSVQYISEVGLSVLPAGRAGNPRDLVSPERLEPALAEIKVDYDLVIIDAPPMRPWADARSMASSVDGVLFVARSGRTRAQNLIRSIRSMDGASLIGAVITDVDAERSHGDRRPRR